MRYVAFLRGINVGKSGRVRMEALRAAFTTFGLENVTTYIQSGNVFFDAPRAPEPDELEAHLERAIGFRPPAAVRTIAAVRTALRAAPFAGMTPADEERFMLLFPVRPANVTLALPVISSDGTVELVSANNVGVFAHIRLRNGRFTDPAKLLERHLGVPATGRFVHTLEAMLAES